MNLHANAPFGPKGRLTMVSRVTEQGWSLTEAAEAVPYIREQLDKMDVDHVGFGGVSA